MPRLFIHIEADEITDALPGNKTMLYSLINRMGMIRMSVDELSAFLHVSDKSIKRWLVELENDGMIRREYKPGKQMVVHTIRINRDKMSQSIRTECTYQKGQDVTIEKEKMSQSTIYNNNINNRGNNDSPEPKEQEEKEVYWGYVIEGINDFYEKRLGRPYVPNWPTQTDSAREISAKVDMMLKADGMDLNESNRRSWWTQFLNRGYNRGDQFHQDNFGLDMINKHFNSLLNRIKNGKGNSIDERRQFAAELDAFLGS